MCSFIQSYKQGVELRTTETKSSEKQSEGPEFRTTRLQAHSLYYDISELSMWDKLPNFSGLISNKDSIELYLWASETTGW